jgi:hypothetical protein
MRFIISFEMNKIFSSFVSIVLSWDVERKITLFCQREISYRKCSCACELNEGLRKQGCSDAED